MAVLTAKQRHGLDPGQFALPGGRYPVPDASHARNALARASQHATPAEQAKIRAAVRSKFPSITVGPKKFAKGGPVQHHLRMAPSHLRIEAHEPKATEVREPPVVEAQEAPLNVHGMPIRMSMPMNAARKLRG